MGTRGPGTPSDRREGRPGAAILPQPGGVPSPPHRRSAAVATCSTYDDVVLPPLPPVPGMVTDAECRYLYWLASTHYRGRGAVVEVGTWLGRSTLHLAAGLRDAGFPEALDCYDQYVW